MKRLVLGWGGQHFLLLSPSLPSPQGVCPFSQPSCCSQAHLGSSKSRPKERCRERCSLSHRAKAHPLADLFHGQVPTSSPDFWPRECPPISGKPFYLIKGVCGLVPLLARRPHQNPSLLASIWTKEAEQLQGFFSPHLWLRRLKAWNVDIFTVCQTLILSHIIPTPPPVVIIFSFYRYYYHILIQQVLTFSFYRQRNCASESNLSEVTEPRLKPRMPASNAF